MSVATVTVELLRARSVAQTLMHGWGMLAPHCAIVGSIRRESPLVHDIDLIAPLPSDPEATDWLYEAIAHDSEPAAEPEPKPRQDGMGLFAATVAPAEPQPKSLGKRCRVVRGVRKGFLACTVEVRVRMGPGSHEPFGTLQLQVFRYVPGLHGNRGWVELMRTGPAEFGRDFLVLYRETQRIPNGQPASRDAFLLDSSGQSVPTPDEQACFNLIGRPFIEPKNRKVLL
ncbi:MAG: hypothetical protein SFZ23_08730 [Planctomycetota bacterium]|nr:hypothetical protein [Planctomycetota bacterium]